MDKASGQSLALLLPFEGKDQEIIGSKGAEVLWHCRAGRERTRRIAVAKVETDWSEILPDKSRTIISSSETTAAVTENHPSFLTKSVCHFYSVRFDSHGLCIQCSLGPRRRLNTKSTAKSHEMELLFEQTTTATLLRCREISGAIFQRE
jgi:hypothetical protein